MGGFVDRLLVQLSDPTQIMGLLAPASDTHHTRLRALIDAVYDLPYATIHDVLDVKVLSTEFERPLLPPGRTSGTWTQTTPSFTRTDVLYQSQNGLNPTWLDLIADISLTLVLEVDPGEVESILIKDLDGFTSLDDFRSRFRFIDLDAFMAKHHLTTVEELQEASQYLLAEIRLRAPAPFDPSAAANRHRYSLHVAFLIRETLDVAAALRDAKLARAAAERALIYHRELDVAEVRSPYAPVVIFPESAVAAPFTAGSLQTFFALERILALFVTPA